MERVVRSITCILDNPTHYSIEDVLGEYELPIGETMYTSIVQAGSSMPTHVQCLYGTYMYVVWDPYSDLEEHIV